MSSCVRWTGRVAAVAVAWAFVAEGPEAAVVTYLYAGAPYTISNYTKEDRPLFTLGHLTLDLDKVPGGSARGLTIEATWDWSPETGEFRHFPEYVLDYGMYNSRQTFDGMDYYPMYSYMYFDDDGQLTEWDRYTFESYGNYSSVNFGGMSREDLPTEPYLGARFEFVDHLISLGYVEGTPEFQAWMDEDIDRSRFDAPAGKWLADPVAFAREVQRNTLLALQNPARSIYDIPPATPGPTPVPIPAPLALMLGGVAALAAARGWRGRAPA